jgi:hypothetical protein
MASATNIIPAEGACDREDQRPVFNYNLKFGLQLRKIMETLSIAD